MLLETLDEKAWREKLGDEKLDHARELQRRAMEHSSEVRGTHLDGHMTGREGEERVVGQDGQTERNGAEDQK